MHNHRAFMPAELSVKKLLALMLVVTLAIPTVCQAQAEGETQRATPAENSPETPIAGKPYHTVFAGKKIDVPASNRRSETAWDVGLAITPTIEKNDFMPIGSVYLWRHPDDNFLLRATLAGLFNDVFAAYSPDSADNFEYVGTFENFTIPFDQSEFVDGERIQKQELTWGYVRLGGGIGWREQVSPGYQDNMRAASITIEPGYFFASRGNSDRNDFVTPQSNFETRLHARFRWDALQRNLVNLAHHGFAMGADLVTAHRSDWDDWGVNSREDGSDHQNYSYATAYIVDATGVPGVASTKHRFISSFHGGVGKNLDRFSAPRVDGGPQSYEYSAIARPVIPGALIREFFPNHYAVATGEYRYQATFFTYVGLRGSVSYLDRNRLRDGDIRRADDVLGSVGVRVTTGFLFDTRVQLEYNYNTGVVRNSDFGGHNVIFHVSGSF